MKNANKSYKLFKVVCEKKHEGNNALRLLEDERSKPSIERREIKGLFVLYLFAHSK
jgi:hypothetical protein